LAGVRQAVALVRDSALLAYVLPQAGESLEAGALRAQLQQQLPAYLVPNAVTVLDHWPLTPNGKLDRAALPNPSRPVPSAQDQEPFTPAEQMLASLWRSLLGLDSVHRSDNFFALGGHSLLATQLVSRIRTLLQVELPVRVLFENPTLLGLAAAVQEARRAHSSLPAVPFTAVDRDRPLPLSFAQQRLWFIDQLEPNSSAYNMPFAARLSGTLNHHAFQRALTELVRRHEILRTVFPADRGEPVQRILAARTVPLPIVDLTQLATSTIDRYRTQEAERAFVLST